MKSRKTFSKYFLVAGVLSASIFLTSCTANSTEPISAEPSASSTSRSASDEDRLYWELCIQNKSGSAISYTYMVSELISGNLVGEIPQQGSTCVLGWVSGADIKLASADNVAKIRIDANRSGWWLWLNSVKTPAIKDLKQSAYLQDAGYKVDFVYSNFRTEKKLGSQYQVKTFNVIVYE